MMKNSAKYSVFGLLLLSTVSLTSLVPGGPIETRDFSHISPLVLGSFNLFLTTLSLTSFLLLYFVWKRQRWAFVASGIWGIGYFLVYVLDLARWFPVSPDAMPPALFAIEVFGTILSIPLAVLSFSNADASDDMTDINQQRGYLGDTLAIDNAEVHKNEKAGLFTVGALATLLGIGIVVFATRAAMGL
ncbi:MAG: hypothetical protein AAF528_03830 [Cyanobacteria bacterium P01_C01_bin.121]